MEDAAAELFAECFETELLETVEEHPDIDTWSVAGKGKGKPEDVAWWRANGPVIMANYVKWRAKSEWKP